MKDILYDNKFIRFIESLAYPIALWNIMVLFFEPIINIFLEIKETHNWTAAINLLYLICVILLRLLYLKIHQHKTKTISDVLILVFGSILLIYDVKFVIFFLLARQLFFIARYFFFHAFEGAVYKVLVKNPPITFLVSFASTILLGTILLMLPSATSSGEITSFLTALFTATSATCVTGLIVVDTGTYYSLFGQFVILLLIQIGGLGIMTISTAFAVILGQKLTLKVENVMHNIMGENMRFDLVSLVKNVVLFTLMIEFIGAVFFYFSFRQIYEPAIAVYYAVFHSVSSFCNAGFALFSDSFSSYIFDIRVNALVTILIIMGGLGFPVIVDLFYQLTKKVRNYSLSLHSKIVLSMTFILLFLGTCLFFISEFNNTMKGFTWGQRVIASWFQSVTCRTAGFNTIDQSSMTSSSSLVSMILMFIGASPGSTGGGVKTSTFALLILSIIALIKGQYDLTVFKRRISTSSIRSSTGLITLSLMFIFIITFIILVIDSFSLENTLYEAVSAFGTVGLSRGITASLSSVSKIMIIILMYIGRVGPLTVLFALSIRKKNLQYSLAEEKVTIG